MFYYTAVQTTTITKTMTIFFFFPHFDTIFWRGALGPEEFSMDGFERWSKNELIEGVFRWSIESSEGSIFVRSGSVASFMLTAWSNWKEKIMWECNYETSKPTDSLDTSTTWEPSQLKFQARQTISTRKSSERQTVHRMNRSILAYTFMPSPKGIVSFKNKQANFPVLLIRYPSHMTTVTETSKIGSVVAGILSIYRVIDSPILFKAGIKEFFDILQARRFTVKTIRQGILKFLRRNCRREYIGFLLQHFFTDIIVTWPHQSDVPASRTVALAMMRHDLMLDVPQSWRERVAKDRSYRPSDYTQAPSDRLRHDLVSITIPQYALHLQTLTERTLPPPPIHRDKEGDSSRSSSAFYSCGSDYYWPSESFWGPAGWPPRD